MKTSNYKMLGITTTISFCIMYGVMFLNLDQPDHFYLGLTRLYMSLLMVAPMVILMILFMKEMYSDKKTNTLIIGISVVIFISALICLRTQTFISDKEYLQAMIPHHSSAIMTSKNANIKDPEVKKLSENIIHSQQLEIEQMKSILNRIDK